jgi:hypothetical protein
MAAATEIAPELGIAPACEALGLGRATFYRRRHPGPDDRIVSIWSFGLLVVQKINMTFSK